MTRLFSAAALGALAIASLTAPAGAATVDLNTWTAESYTSVAGFLDGVWTPAPDGSSVYQSENGQPTVFFSDFTAYGTKVSGKITVENGAGDDDFIGFVIGFDAGDSTSASADYLLVDWKRAGQGFNFGAPSSTPGGNAPAGLAVSRVTGVPTADEFWQHADYSAASGGGAGAVEELQRGATLGSTGWNFATAYEFSFDFGPGNLVVSVDGSEEINIAGSFANGRLGFYNFSQQNVRYSAFTVDPGSFPPPGNAVPEPATWAMMIGGLGLVGARMRRRTVRVAMA